MIYREFQDKKLSLLGFGAMRLPQTESTGSVDREKAEAMIDYAMAHGINYYDTAYPYHSGESELVLGEILEKYPRDSYYLATKFPGHQISDSYDPAEVFEEQLRKCRVDYFDFYLLHNVCESSIKTYLDPKWGIIDYFLKQKENGRIRHLGFSSHGGMENLEEFLNLYGDKMEFCQLQINYLDWTLQDAGAKYELLTSRNIPVWVMEPVRGGRLSNLNENEEGRLRAMRPEESSCAWAFRFLQGLSNVPIILSGMTTMEQLEENIATFEEPKPLSEEERNLLFDIAEGMKDSVPCTACRYCCDGCPAGLDIPALLAMYNEARFAPGIGISMRIDAMPEEKRPAACIGCGKCSQVCPQAIDIPAALASFDEELKKMPNWEELCRQRAAAQKRG